MNISLVAPLSSMMDKYDCNQKQADKVIVLQTQIWGDRPTQHTITKVPTGPAGILSATVVPGWPRHNL